MRFQDSNRLSIKRFAGVVLAAALLAAAPSQATEIEQQRKLFQSVYETVERGDWSPVDDLTLSERALLERYVLWPDLRAVWLRANLKKTTPAEIDAFLDQYGTLRPARDLRYRKALSLAKKGDLAGYQKIYEQFYQGQGDSRLNCLSLQAEIEAGRFKRVNQRAVDLWMTGTSQVRECDPVFEYLYDNKLLGPVEYRKRFELAIEAREFQLARWLAKKIDKQHVDAATSFMRAQSHPDGFLAGHDPAADSETYREQLVYAAERLTYRDPESALQLWNKLEMQYGFSEEQKLHTRRHIALWTARDNLPGGYRLLAKLPQAAQDDEVLRWRARTSLRDIEWQRLLVDIAAMKPAERDTEEWRYWRAIALLRFGQTLAAGIALGELSKVRSYYGFLAADELGTDYALDHDRLAADETALNEIATRPEVVRAREHSRAIATASSLGQYDDLAMRYPLPWQQQFEKFSTAASIAPTWAYGIARSESLFMRDVRSSAGAVGLMQLMPATGREVAKNISLPYSGIATLTNPESNIRLGTSYLAQMSQQFSGNPVLATAAYNAGPHRVMRWLPQKSSEDARVWIENIPFNETRKYVKRVLAAQAIFHWRMTGQVRRLSDELLLVEADAEAQLASR
jgi:soluble lytic murein transglycosylase